MYNYLKPRSLSNIATTPFWLEAISTEHTVYFDDRNMISLKRIHMNYNQVQNKVQMVDSGSTKGKKKKKKDKLASGKNSALWYKSITSTLYFFSYSKISLICNSL